MKIILLLLLPLYSFSQTSFNGCPASGDNKSDKVQVADYLKNRDIVPLMYAHYDISDMLTMIISDTTSEATAVTINGYILDIKDGGKESCNCHSATNKDTHIYIVKDSSVTDAGQAIIVEATPRFRQVLGTSAELKAKYLHHNVAVFGYLFKDEEHKANSTVDHGKGLLWRGSTWELHPVTGIELR